MKLLEKYKQQIMIGLYITVGLFVMYWMIYLFTPKPQIPDEIKKQLGEVNKVVTEMQLSQKKYDNLLVEQSKISTELDAKISNIKEKVVIIREYYREKSAAVDKYTPTQIDSFLKNRYNY